MASPLIDDFGRRHTDLRISITDRCNFRCTYCMSEEGMEWMPRAELLSYEEIERIARVLVDEHGFESIRITGGEPTIRAHLPVLIEKLAALDVDLALTTNGATLASQADDLRAAGLDRVNISIDSLRADRFEQLTRRDELARVLDGIRAAVAAGFDQVKLNAVVIRGVNDDELVDLARFGRDEGVTVRFIEFMPLDAEGNWTSTDVVAKQEIVDAVSAVYPLAPVEGGNEPASRFRFVDRPEGAPGSEIGVIASVTDAFCESCDRVRLTADGQLRNCLFALDDFDLRGPIRGGATDADLSEIFERAVSAKWRGHAINQVQFIRPSRSMSQIGG
jgi:cyclic pyranopterin phosphate synthase